MFENKLFSLIFIVDEYGHIDNDWLLARKIHYEQLEEVKDITSNSTHHFLLFFFRLVSIYSWSSNSIHGKKDDHKLIENFDFICSFRNRFYLFIVNLYISNHHNYLAK
jgi:hypothetical protein